MYKLITTIFSLICILLSSIGFAAEVDLTNPYTMVQQVTTNTFARIKNERQQAQLSPLSLNNIVIHELMPYIDYRFSALKILGKYYRQYPKDKINQYTEIFKNYSVSVFSTALNYYNDQTIEFEPAKEFKEQKQVVVRLHINDINRSISLSFIVRKDSNTGQWRVYDIVAEGISMLSSLQSEFEPMLRKEGLDAVMQTMTNSAN